MGLFSFLRTLLRTLFARTIPYSGQLELPQTYIFKNNRVLNLLNQDFYFEELGGSTIICYLCTVIHIV